MKTTRAQPSLARSCRMAPARISYNSVHWLACRSSQTFAIAYSAVGDTFTFVARLSERSTAGGPCAPARITL